MTIRCSFLATWTVVAALGAATLGSGAAEAGDFAAFDFSRYVPHSVRSKIESYFDKAPVAKPKHNHAAGTNSAVVTESNAPVAASGTMLPPLMPAGRDCLSKQLLATGAVLFKDVCTKEWAINSTGVAGQKVGGKCLTKVTHPDGVVMFRDVCSDEWAMNTTELARQRTAPRG
jgi:hypothetical protein